MLQDKRTVPSQNKGTCAVQNRSKLKAFGSYSFKVDA